MLLIKGFKCAEVINVIRGILKDMDIGINYLDDDQDLCAVTFSGCWYIDEEGVKWYRGRCACDEFNRISCERLIELIMKLVAEFSDIELVVATPAPFVYPWGPLTLHDVPPKVVAVNRGVMKIDNKFNSLCIESLSAQGLNFLPHVVSCFFLLDLIKGYSALANLVRYEERNNIAFIERVVSDDYCRYMSESQES